MREQQNAERARKNQERRERELREKEAKAWAHKFSTFNVKKIQICLFETVITYWAPNKEAEEARRLEEEARKKKEAMDKLNKLNRLDYHHSFYNTSNAIIVALIKKPSQWMIALEFWISSFDLDVIFCLPFDPFQQF